MAISSGSVARGLVSTSNASVPANPDNQNVDVAMRVDKYGGMMISSVSPTDHLLAEEGSYIVASNPTIGTGETWVAAQTAFSDTTPNFYLFNGEPAGGKTVRMRYLKMIATAAATSATAIHYAFILDNVARAWTTDHSDAGPIPVNAINGTAGLPKGLLVKVQNSATASVIAASSSNKIVVARGTLGGLNIAGDELVIVFGSQDAGAYVGSADAANQPARRCASEHPVIIPPGFSLTGHLWMPSSAASFNPEWSLGLIAR